MKPHKHAEIIKKWADGYVIQFRRLTHENWTDISDPCWDIHAEYRVKPIVKWYALFKDCPEAHYYNSKDEVLEACGGCCGFIKALSVEIES